MPECHIKEEGSATSNHYSFHRTSRYSRRIAPFSRIGQSPQRFTDGKSGRVEGAAPLAAFFGRYFVKKKIQQHHEDGDTEKDDQRRGITSAFGLHRTDEGGSEGSRQHTHIGNAEIGGTVITFFGISAAFGSMLFHSLQLWYFKIKSYIKID